MTEHRARSIRKYRFEPVDECVMCGSGRPRHRMIGMRLSGSQGMNPARAAGIAVSVKRCRDCGLIFADPMPIPEQMSDHYDLPPEEYWDEGTLDEDRPRHVEEIAVAKRLLSSDGPLKALDIGAGLGKTMRSLEQAGFEAFGIEPSQPFHERAIAKMGIDPSRLQLAPLEEAEFAPETFDFITFGAVLEHLYNPGEAIGKALGWLKRGGIIHAEVPSSDHLVAKIINMFFRLPGTNYVTHISPMHPPFHLYEFTLDSFRKHGERSRYAIAEHRYMVCGILNMPRIAHPLLRWLMERTDTGLQLVVYLRKS